MNTKSELVNQGLAALIILLLCSIAIMLFGCAENPAGPTAVNNEKSFVNVADTTSVNDDNNGVDPFAADTTFVDADTVSFLVGAEGNHAHLFLQGKKVDVTVPAGALEDTVTIVVIGTRYRIGKTSDFYTYNCGPDGLQFNVPLELKQLIARPNGFIATLMYYDDSSNDGDGIGWESIGVSQVTGGVGVFLLHHFSKYGISCAASDTNTEINNETHCD